MQEFFQKSPYSAVFSGSCSKTSPGLAQFPNNSIYYIYLYIKKDRAGMIDIKSHHPCPGTRNYELLLSAARFLLTVEPVAKVGYFCTALAVFALWALRLKPYETCIFQRLLLQN
jgi:hypothetical protein